MCCLTKKRVLCHSREGGNPLQNKQGIASLRSQFRSARNDAPPTDRSDRLKLSLSLFYTVLCYNFSLFYRQKMLDIRRETKTILDY
jgi:hypothetical protein